MAPAPSVVVLLTNEQRFVQCAMPELFNDRLFTRADWDRHVTVRQKRKNDARPRRRSAAESARRRPTTTMLSFARSPSTNSLSIRTKTTTPRSGTATSPSH